MCKIGVYISYMKLDDKFNIGDGKIMIKDNFYILDMSIWSNKWLVVLFD